jgi:hypothetical protein
MNYIFQIGFNRCGTSSIAHFFNENGFSAAHWEKGTLAVGMELAKIENKPLLTYCKEFDIYTDLEKVNMWRLPKLKWRYRIFRKYLKKIDLDIDAKAPIYAYKYFQLLEEQYPESKFILNTRSKKGWVESRLNLNKKNKRITYRSCKCGDNFHNTEDELVRCWEEEWDKHHKDVLEYFSDKEEKLLYFNIEEDSIDKLINFFPELELDATYWQKRNKTVSNR